EARYKEAAEVLSEIPAGAYPAGMVETAMDLLRQAPSVPEAAHGESSLGYLGFVYLFIGAPLRALEFFERDLEAEYLSNAFIAELWHSSYVSVRKTERFKSLVRKMGLVD